VSRYPVRLLIIVAAAVIAPLSSARAADPSEGAAEKCIPVSERAGREFGCFIVASHAIGALKQSPSYWHITSFPTRTAAAEQGQDARSTVIEALGKVWLMTIADPNWHAAGGTRVAKIGPLPIMPGTDYTAQFMEAVFQPGMKSTVHRHSGPEAWYTLSGESCLETPQGRMVGRAGGSQVIVPGGPPMELTASGSGTRKALVLILHDSGQPATTPASDWHPKGLCNGVT
jgi:quercetin dioxygenase-like cupin family protein